MKLPTEDQKLIAKATHTLLAPFYSMLGCTVGVIGMDVIDLMTGKGELSGSIFWILLGVLAIHLIWFFISFTRVRGMFKDFSSAQPVAPGPEKASKVSSSNVLSIDAEGMLVTYRGAPRKSLKKERTTVNSSSAPKKREPKSDQAQERSDVFQFPGPVGKNDGA